MFFRDREYRQSLGSSKGNTIPKPSGYSAKLADFLDKPDFGTALSGSKLILIALTAALSMILINVAHVSAQSKVAEEQRAADSQPSTTESVVPPFPFNSPQIGPIVKRGFEDDVDRWTTAFIPRSLDYLTAVEMPDTNDRWVRVDLSEQTVIAYEGDKPVRGFIVSTGLPRTPTVTGTFHIRTKVRSQTMTGGDPALGNYYDLPNVQWVQYFYEDYGLHGTYWHKKYGQPMSHGCINMTNADAKWLFDWAGPEWDGKSTWLRSTSENPGTLVIVHE